MKWLVAFAALTWLAACETADPTEPDAAPDSFAADSSDAGAAHDAAADVPSDDGPQDLPQDVPPDASEPPVPVGSLSYGPPEAWAKPIEDYLAAGFEELKSYIFDRGIADLAAYRGKLYLGYGDATYNLGRVIPIEFRAFTSPDDPQVTHELASDEEQLDRYRRVGDDLLMAGVDATEDAWLGNVYRRRPDTGWTKYRNVPNGVHVHDVAGWGGAVYAVGSGATPEEWNAGDIYGHLWRSSDDLESFEIVERTHNGGVGDARWIRLLPLPSALFVFGYKINADGLISELPHGTWDGATFSPLSGTHPLALAHVVETDVIAQDAAIVRGIDFSGQASALRAWRMLDNGAVEAIEVFEQKTVIDVTPVEATGEVVLLTADTPNWSPGDASGFEVFRAWLSQDADSFSQLFEVETHIPLRSIAYFAGAIFCGTDRGEVWRSVGQP